MSHSLLQVSATLLLLLFLSPPTTTAAPVLDINGDLVLANNNYYILPVFRGRGGGLTLFRRNSTCPFYVGQDSLEVSQGLPLKFYPVNSKQLPVTLSTDLNIVFDAFTICVQSTVWRLTSLDGGFGRRLYVGTGGQTGNPGSQTLSNWFKIEKAGTGEFDYKIVFCPTVCETCRPACGDVGVFIENGKRWLGLMDQPLLVRFKKVSDHETSSI